MAEEETMDDVFVIEEATDPEAAVHVVGETIETLLDTTGVEKVYGSPVRRGDYTIIPTAEVVAGIGFGVGFGSGEAPGGDGDEGQAQTGGGGGGGGGGRTLSRPVAVVIVGPEGVRVEPVIDATKVALAALTAFGFMFTTMKRMRRGLLRED